ncbi:MFS transporter [Paenibacillus sp. CC-CFT747]|nr:MFS transporter [Paenibacillus sp. CC-CFT747]
MVLGSYGFTQILVRLPLGLLSDRLRRRRPFIMLGLLTGALSCLLFMGGEEWGWTLAGRIMSGVSASTWVAYTVLYASYYSESDSTKAMGSISLMTVAGQLAGMAVSGWLADSRGWNAPFVLGGVIGAVGLLAAFAVKEPRDGVARPPIRLNDLGKVIRTRTLLIVSGLSVLAHSVLFITMFGFTPLQASALGASRSELTLLVFAFMVPHALSAYYSGKRLAPRWGTPRTIVAGFLLSGLCTFAIPFVPSLAWLYVTQAVNGFAQGLHMPLLLGLSIRPFASSERATAMGFYQAVYSAGMFAGPFLAGWLNASAGLPSGFYLGGGLALMAAAFAWAAGQHRLLQEG